ncbi:MAG: mechanosensitive ion channel family protein [Alphaproteobacteria bacterium]|nr:mechanosensitive ion channel family protein [Alphaproteobacteria bacterium]
MISTLGNRIVRVARRPSIRLRSRILARADQRARSRCGRATLALLLLLPLALPALAQAPAPAAQPDAPPQVRALLNLLADPAVRDWLEKQHGASQAARPAAPAEPELSPAGFVAERVGLIRQHLTELAAAAPKLPGELEGAATILLLEFEGRGLVEILFLLVGFVALGFGVQGLFLWATGRTRRRIVELSLDSVAERLRAVMARLAYGLGMITSFAIGSVGAFLVFPWPPLVREILLGYLLAFLAVRLAMVIGRFFLAPGAERFRILPMSTEAAVFWYRRLILLVAWFGVGWVTVEILGILGLPPPSRRLVAYALGLGLLAIALEMLWRRPVEAGQRRRGAATVLGSVYFVVVWLLWVAGSVYGLWLALLAAGLVASIRTTQRGVNHILRPPGMATAETGPPSVYAVALERGLRAGLIIAAALLLARGWHIDLGALTQSDTVFTRLLRGALTAVVIVLIADFAWHVLKTLIDRKLIEAQDLGRPETDEAHRKARLRTLLPILRNVIFIVLLAMAVLMALSSIGVEIGPLIAGAGVVGVAIGFGAQTLVRDIISGVFFLTDDAFRVGEYIQSGNFKGTVESFSLRSVKLRHHRGPLYTVPFGTLGAVQNMSRDWVIDKMQVGVTYDTDLDKARKLIKQVGKDLAEDPELGPNIIETLKMQGVEQFGDFAIQLRMKMMTKPGEQFVIRRKAYAMIKKAFDANGIKFAFPTVQVAGGVGDAAAAAARQGLAMTQPQPE